MPKSRPWDPSWCGRLRPRLRVAPGEHRPETGAADGGKAGKEHHDRAEGKLDRYPPADGGGRQGVGEGTPLEVPLDRLLDEEEEGLGAGEARQAG